MSADVITPAVLGYIDHNAYPESEGVSSAELSSNVLEALTPQLRKDQDVVKDEIRSLSRNTAQDVDTWISRAKQLQEDILRSRQAAREIVEEAEQGRELKSKAEDRRRKVELLEREVWFQENVGARLEHIQHARGVLEDVGELVVKGELQRALGRLEEAEDSIGGLASGSEGGVGAVLWRRVDGLRDRLKEAVVDDWNERIVVQQEERRISMKDGLGGLVAPAKGLGIFDDLVSKLSKDVDRAIVRPRLALDADGQAPTISVSEGQLSVHSTREGAAFGALFGDLKAIVESLALRLPASVAVPLSESLIPALTTRLEVEWLEPAVPLKICDMLVFQEVLDDVASFADQIDQLGWHGSNALREWVQSAPRTWLTKRREAVLGDVRNLVFTGLHEKKVVERVETQMVSKEDTLGGGAEGGDDDWDTAWDEPEDPSNQSAQTNEEIDEASAWNLPDDETSKDEANDEDDAWGWGDGEENASQNPNSPKVTRKEPVKVNGDKVTDKPNGREMTLRETFTVTAIPDGILDLVQQVITDAETLAGPEYASSPIAPAATALYTLPTLALAIYRATAPTAYAKLDTGNMLIYNDASRLSDQLRSWQASQPPSSRLRLDNDVKALDQFSKRAYSSEMESQRTILRDLLDGAQGFSNSTTSPFKQECESAVEQTTDRLRDVHRQWEPILSQSALLQSIGSLLATVTGKMITEIEDLPDIGEAESKQLKFLCDRTSQVKQLFFQQRPDGENGDMTFIYCPNWLKFQYLAEIMESSLADIKYLWGEGELSLEFEAEEVVGLIEALFAESQLRRQAIQDVRAGGR